MAEIASSECSTFSLRTARGMLRLGERTIVMGILNVTADSFSDGGQFLSPEKALQRAKRMVEEGADWIDVGGESTRPGAEPVRADEELCRTAPVVEAIAKELRVPVSIDTSKAAVAEGCLEAGAAMVNDVTALRGDPGMVDVLVRFDAPVVLMHMKGTPRTMQSDPSYQDLLGEILDFLRSRISFAEAKGLSREQLLVDPGIGFGKTAVHNLTILRRLGELRSLGVPVVVGPSRKSFLGAVLGLPVEERLEGTAAAVAASVFAGASVVRVHDVKEMVRVARVCDAILSEPRP